MGAHWSKNRGREWSSSWSAPLELIDRSSINDSDLISNLRWSLTEAMRWNERALSVKDIICVEGSDPTKNLSKSQQDERYLATLELLDNVLHDGTPSPTTASSTATKAKESVKSLFTSKSSDQEKAASAASKEAAKSPPSSTVGAVTLLPPSSSKLFGAAACKFVIASINAASLTGARSTIAGETRSKISQAMSAIQKTIASTESQAQSGGIGIQQPTISGESGVESNILPPQTIQEAAKEQLAFCHDDIVEKCRSESMNERVEIACKYIYLSSLMNSLSHSTAWCYQLHEKMKWFTSCINDLNVSAAKGNRQQNEVHKKQMELAKDRVYLLLQDGLKSHDRWRCVLRLLYRDFELCIARHKLMNECARFAYYRENPRQAAVWSMNEIDDKINTLNAQKQPLDLEIEKNERDALSCGLAFLDKNLSGSLEAEESPELNAKLFHMLDLQNRAAISYTDLHGGVLSIQSKLENITARIQVLQQQNEQLKQRSMYASYQSTATAGIASAGGADEAVIMQNDAEIEQLKRASVDQWNNLQQIYSAFFNAFAQSVFPSVQLNEIDQLQSQSLANGDGIVQIIDQIAKNALTDPLITMQTKLQRGDESLISQASLDAAIIAQSQQTPLTAALGGETAPLTIPMVLATTPATEHRPPAAFEQTTKPKSAMEVKAAEKAVEASKRELGREKQFAEHPSETGSMEQQLGVKDVQSNVQAAREAARGRAAEMRTSEMENVSPRWPKQESQTTDRPSYQPSFAEKEERTVPQKEIESYSPTITRQTPLAQTRAAEPPTDKEPPSATEYQEKGLRADDQQMKFEGRHVHQRVAMPAAHYEQQPIEKGPSQQPAIGEENISRGEYVEKPASLEQRTPPSDYDQSQQQRFLSEGGRPSEYQQQPIKGGYEEEQQRLGYGGTGEQYWTPAPTEKGTGASQQKETQFSAEPSMMTERPESIPQSPERQSKSWTESIKETVRGVTGGSQTGTH